MPSAPFPDPDPHPDPGDEEEVATYDAFHEHYSEPAAVYVPLAVARRELGVSAESCQAAVERIRCSLGLGHAARQA